MTPRVISWDDPPQMDTGAPLPVIRCVGASLVVCYVCANPQFRGWNNRLPFDHPGFEFYSALVRFDGVIWHHFGPPSDERLYEHPLYSYGLRHYGFWEVLDSHKVQPDTSKHYWVVTFHDETLEVLADSVTIISTRVEGENTWDIADQYLRGHIQSS